MRSGLAQRPLFFMAGKMLCRDSDDSNKLVRPSNDFVLFLLKIIEDLQHRFDWRRSQISINQLGIAPGIVWNMRMQSQVLHRFRLQCLRPFGLRFSLIHITCLPCVVLSFIHCFSFFPYSPPARSCRKKVLSSHCPRVRWHQRPSRQSRWYRRISSLLHWHWVAALRAVLLTLV